MDLRANPRKALPALITFCQAGHYTGLHYKRDVSAWRPVDWPVKSGLITKLTGQGLGGQSVPLTSTTSASTTGGHEKSHCQSQQLSFFHLPFSVTAHGRVPFARASHCCFTKKGSKLSIFSDLVWDDHAMLLQLYLAMVASFCDELNIHATWIYTEIHFLKPLLYII